MKVNFRQGVVSYQVGGFLQITGSDVSLLASNRSVTVTLAHKDTDYTHSEDNSVNNAWTGPFIEPKYWLYWNFDPLTFARTFGTTTLEPVAQSVAPGTGDTAITGVVAGTGSPITSAFIVDGSYSLSIDKPFAVIGSTANDGNYTVSSISIGGSPLQTTIYVNEPVNSVVVDGSVTLDVDSDGNPLKVEGRHWYDTSIGVHYVLNGGVWQSVLRIFAAQLLNGNTFISVNQEANTGNFSGTQIGNNTAVFSGRILFDESSDPIRRDDGTFFTTEDQFFTNQSRVDALRLESNVTRAQCIAAALSAFSVVAWTNDGQVNAAQYDDVGSTVVGILTENLTNLEVGAIIVQGAVTNPAWNWTAGGNPVAVGSSLWVENGLLTATNPNLNDPVTYPIARVPVARVLDKDTIIFEQGLGGVGVQGPQGLPADLIAADTTDLGSVTLLTASSDSARAFVISDTDSRLTDARTPLTHTHQAADVTFQPGGGLASTDVQSAVVELGTDKLNLSGGSLTGFLTLNADPTAVGHAASKQYVDNNITAVDHTAISNIGTNTHTQIDTHISDGTIHFTEASIDHVNILNIGTNTHIQIDTHIADATIHSNTLNGLSDVNTSGSPAVTDGQMLTWNNSAGYWENVTVDILVFADKATAVAFTLTAAAAGRKIFINSGDGGEFTIEYNATLGTYVDNGGSFCGTEFIPSGGDGTIGIVRDYDGYIYKEWFGYTDASTTTEVISILSNILATDQTQSVAPQDRMPRKLFKQIYEMSGAATHLKTLSIGDSLGYVKYQQFMANLDRKMGGENISGVNSVGTAAGAGNATAGHDLFELTLTGAVAETSAYDYWITGNVTRVDSGGSIDFSFNGVAPTFEDITIYVIKESAAGTIKLTVGGTDRDTLNCNAAISMGKLTYSQTSAQATVQVSTTGGAVRVIFAHVTNPSLSGVDDYLRCAISGLSLNTAMSNAQGVAILDSVIADITPDLVTFEMDDDFETSTTRTAFETLRNTLDVNAQYADKLITTSTPRQTNNQGKKMSDLYLRLLLTTFDISWLLFDGFNSIGTYADMVAIFGADDGTHPNKAAQAYLAATLWDRLGLNSEVLGFASRALSDISTPSKLANETSIGRLAGANVIVKTHSTSFNIDWHLGVNRSLSIGDQSLGVNFRISNQASVSNVIPNSFDIGSAGSGQDFDFDSVTGQVRYSFNDTDKDTTQGNCLLQAMFNPCVITKAVLIGGDYPANSLKGTIVRVTDGAAGDGLYIAIGGSTTDWQKLSFSGAV